MNDTRDIEDGTLDELILQLESLDPEKRRKAILALAETSSLEAIEALEKCGRYDTNLELRFLAKKAAERIKSRIEAEAKEDDVVDMLRVAFAQDSPDKKLKVLKAAATSHPADRKDELLSELANLLKIEKNCEVKSTILLSSAMIGGEKALEIIVSALHDPDPMVRLNCVKALGILDIPKIYPFLVDALSDRVHKISSRAYGLLRRLGKRRIVKVLERMSSSSKKWMRKSVAKAGRRLNMEEMAGILERLTHDEEKSISKAAVRSLKKLAVLGNRAAMEIVGSSVRDDAGITGRPLEEPSVQPPAEAIESTLQETSTSYTMNAEVSESIAAQALSPGQRIRASQTAGFVFDGDGKGGTLPIDADDPDERMRILQEIVEENDPARIPELLHRLPREDDARVRSAIVAALGKLGDEKEIPYLKRCLEDEVGRVRANAVEAIAAIAPPNMAELLEPMLADRDNRVRANTIVALFEEMPDECLQVLREMAERGDAAQRSSAVYAALQVATGEAAEILSSLSNDVDENVATKAAEALRLLSDRGIRPPHEHRMERIAREISVENATAPTVKVDEQSFSTEIRNAALLDLAVGLPPVFLVTAILLMKSFSEATLLLCLSAALTAAAIPTAAAVATIYGLECGRQYNILLGTLLPPLAGWTSILNVPTLRKSFVKKIPEPRTSAMLAMIVYCGLLSLLLTLAVLL